MLCYINCRVNRVNTRAYVCVQYYIYICTTDVNPTARNDNAPSAPMRHKRSLANICQYLYRCIYMSIYVASYFFVFIYCLFAFALIFVFLLTLLFLQIPVSVLRARIFEGFNRSAELSIDFELSNSVQCLHEVVVCLVNCGDTFCATSWRDAPTGPHRTAPKGWVGVSRVIGASDRNTK